MQLWTEYEGLTIEGAIPLNKLLSPEGRSAFFATANGKGEPVFVRLIECHFDEEDILARWRWIETLGQDNFLRLERYGKLTLDDGPVVYAVFEKVDAKLSDVLERGRLSREDVVEIAISLTAALEVLHSSGFVHEHVDAGNVFAVGEVVKLRGDCIREAPEGQDGARAKQRDIEALAVLCLQALTQRKTLEEAAREAALPAPFDQIVRYGITGAWGLTEIRAALAKYAPRPKPAPVKAEAARPVAVRSEKPSARPAAAVVAEPEERRVVRDEQRTVSAATATAARPRLEKPQREAEPEPAEQLNLNLGRLSAVPMPERRRDEKWEDSLKTRWIGAAALILILCFAAGWLYARIHRGHATQAQAATTSASRPLTVIRRNGAAGVAAASGFNTPAPRQADTGPRQWRVIAYTYDHADDARKKAAALAGKYPGLQPAVFRPRHSSRYLVTLGGVMTREDAFALEHKARGMGLPRDTYAQNYSSKR